MIRINVKEIIYIVECGKLIYLNVILSPKIPKTYIRGVIKYKYL